MEHILLTGFPGLLAERLIRSCREAEAEVFWHLLVLPDEMNLAGRRIRALGLTAPDYSVYSGDITRPDLGLPGRDAERIQGLVQRCYHLAALYDLTAAAAVSDAVNIRGTQRVCEFLKRCPNLRKFNYISTCYVSGTREGPIEEDALPEPASFRNEYERTKHWAEHVVRDYVDDLPTTIFRPGIVVGDSQTGETGKFDGPYVIVGFFQASRRLIYRLPNLGFDTSWLNLVPIDFVTTVLRDVGLSDEFDGKTIQIADPNPPTTSESYEAMYAQVTGRKCFNLDPKLREVALRLIRRFPIDLITGISAESIEYFHHRGQYKTDNLRQACRRFGIEIPQWQEFYKPVIRYALTERKPAPNAGLMREFRRWCLSFRFIYVLVGLLFLFAPGSVARLLTVLDDPTGAEALLRDNLLWRPLGVSLLVALFVAVTFLQRNPFQKSLHGLIIGAKMFSTGIFFTYAAMTGLISLIACGVIDGLICLMHSLFYYRLRRVRDMEGSEFRWDPYSLLFPKRFVAAFAESMVPELNDPIDIRTVVENVRAEVGGFPALHRYAFVLACYYVEFILPVLSGFRPFPLMDKELRREFLKRLQYARRLWQKMPMVFVKLICTAHVFAQKPYLRSIGAE
ncbi:MAG: SDR family oxidoreductase [Phycisphaerae bacterium]|nr:SDR family oxidoreductase [Phycisphaerae bacterium]